MTALLTFANDHWFITWCALWLVWGVLWLASVSIAIVTDLIRSIIIRTYRLIMVVCRGWPPVHLDADGDWKEQPTTETTNGDQPNETI